MYIGEIITLDTANGPGFRVSVFISGCNHHCKGCFQPETWNYKYGKPYTEEMLEDILRYMESKSVNGITFLGGDPMCTDPVTGESNQEGLLNIILAVKTHYPEKSVMIYTGYEYEDLLPGGAGYTQYTEEILKHTTFIVDGRFIEEKKDFRLKFRGSSNQRIIDVQKTRESGEIVLSPLSNKIPDKGVTD